MSFFTPDFTEWTPEQKKELADRKLREMKEKNEKLLKRYAEVEHDRREAEINNSAITNVTKAPKKDSKVEAFPKETKVEYDREWDRGKSDKNYWKSPDHRGSFKSYHKGRYERKDSWNSRNEGNDSWQDHTYAGHQERKDFDRNETWGNYSRNENSEHYRSDRTSDMQGRRPRGNYRYKQYDDQQNFSRLQRSPKRARGVAYRTNEQYRNSQYSQSDDKYKRSDYNKGNSRKRGFYRAHSRSSSRSESDFVGNNTARMPVPSTKTSSLWQNDKISEDQSKQNRVEKWVKSVNKSNWGRGKPFSSDQKDKNRSRSYSKFDRFVEHSSAESSPDDKSEENNNNASKKLEYQVNKQQNTDAFVSGVESPKQKDGNKTFKTKCSPQYMSGSSSKNDHIRKRRFENRGFKYNEKNKFVKCVMDDNNDSWNNSTTEKFIRKKTPDLSNNDTWNHSNDNWGTAVPSRVNDDVWENVGQAQADDGWETAEQSNIRWNLSDEEDAKESKNMNIKHVSVMKKSSRTWKGSFSSSENVQNSKQVVHTEDLEDTWGHAQQDDRNLKLATAEAKSEANDGWEDYESSPNLNEIAEQLEKQCKIGDKIVDRGFGGKISKGNSNVEAIKPEKSTKKQHDKNSDGWSTVSEEGEIHSDEDPDSEWKKDDGTSVIT